MNKLIRGIVRIEDSIVDLKHYATQKEEALKNVIAWADRKGISIQFFFIHNRCVCEYYVEGKTLEDCKKDGVAVRAQLKQEWPDMCVVQRELVYNEERGDFADFDWDNKSFKERRDYGENPFLMRYS